MSLSRILSCLTITLLAASLWTPPASADHFTIHLRDLKGNILDPKENAEYKPKPGFHSSILIYQQDGRGNVENLRDIVNVNADKLQTPIRRVVDDNDVGIITFELPPNADGDKDIVIVAQRGDEDRVTAAIPFVVVTANNTNQTFDIAVPKSLLHAPQPPQYVNCYCPPRRHRCGLFGRRR